MEQQKNKNIDIVGILTYVSIITGVVLLFCAFVLFYEESHNAHAETYKHMAIEFSETCKAAQDLERFENCPDPNLIESMFPPSPLKPAYQTMFNNSRQGQAETYQKNNAILNHKFSCIKSDYCNVFDVLPGQKVIYWYDPDSKSMEYFDARIIINANIKHKNLNVAFDTIDDNGTARKIDLDTNQVNIKYCKIATYDPNNIETELGYLIWYLSNNCTNIKQLGILADPYTIPLDKTDIGILEDSYKWSWLFNQTAIKEKYKEYRIGKD